MDGLYVSITPEGKLKRHLSVQNREVPLEDTTIENEIMLLLDASHLHTARFTKKQLKLIPDCQMSNRAYCKFTNGIERFLSEQEQADPMYAMLTRTAMNREITYPNEILLHLQEPIRAQIIAVGVIDELIAGLPTREQVAYPLLRKVSCTAISSLTEPLTLEYVFRSIFQYYSFLIQRFVSKKPNIAKCQYCGRYFFPKTKRKTLYCDRIIRDGKTCKQIAPYENHKRLAAANRVVAEFDRVKGLLSHRLDRTCVDKKPSPIDLTDEAYYDWLDKATIARKKFLSGEITEEEALAAIHVPTKKELLEKESADYTLD